MIKKQRTVLFLILLAFFTRQCLSQKPATPESRTPLNPGDMPVLHFEEMQYPEMARRSPYPPEGVVVVKIDVDNQGKVSNAKLISGNPILVPDTLANIKKWQFSTTKANTGVVVYNFRRIWGACGSLNSLFALQYSNFVSVMGCVPATAESRAEVEPQKIDGLSDDEMTVVHFDPAVKYPPLARTARIEGVVVVRAKLGKDGKVVSAITISCHPLLALCCAENAMKWVFQPNSEKTAVIVYLLKRGVSDDIQILFEPPNFVTVEAPAPILETSSSH